MKNKSLTLIVILLILFFTIPSYALEEITIEAEDMTQDDCNSIENGVNILSGTIYTTVTFENSGMATFEIIALEDKGGDAAPILQLLIDDKEIDSITVENTEWTNYTITTEVEAGSHKITLSFTNDYYDSETGDDRNVGVDKTIIYIESEKFIIPDDIIHTVQAEDFDSGGEGVAYHDTTEENTGECNGGYREDEGVDVCTNDPNEGCHVGHTSVGEWTTYTYDFPESGKYNIDLYVGSKNENSNGILYVDGENPQTFQVSHNETWHEFYPSTLFITVTKGNHTIKIEQGDVIFVFDKFTIINNKDTIGVNVKWDANEPVPEGYRVFYRHEKNDFDYTKPKNTFKFYDGNITSGTTASMYSMIAPRGMKTVLYFVVRAYEDTLESEDSETVSIVLDRTDLTIDYPTQIHMVVD